MKFKSTSTDKYIKVKKKIISIIMKTLTATKNTKT